MSAAPNPHTAPGPQPKNHRPLPDTKPSFIETRTRRTLATDQLPGRSWFRDRAARQPRTAAQLHSELRPGGRCGAQLLSRETSWV